MLWVIFPIVLSLVSFIGTWAVYGLALANYHVCSLSDWASDNYCDGNKTTNCCHVPTISSSGINAPENSLFTATINAGSFLFLLFCLLHHAHVMERHTCHSMLSKLALVFGVVAAVGAFMAGNCNPGYLQLLHYLGAAISFMCICFYTVLLTSLTGKCVLSGYEKLLYPLRIASTVSQTFLTIGYAIFFAQPLDYQKHLAALFEWILSVNLAMFELSYVMEFYYFSSFMITNLLSKREEQKPLMLSLS